MADEKQPGVVLDFSPTFSLQLDYYTKQPKAITCKACDRTSYHADDVAQRYCGFCKVFHNDIPPSLRSEWVQTRRKEIGK